MSPENPDPERDDESLEPGGRGAMDPGMPPDSPRAHRVGVRGLRYPISVLDRSQRTQSTVADIDLYVDGADHAGCAPVHRFIEVLNTVHGELTIRNLPQLLTQVQRAFDARRAALEVGFPYFIQKVAPASGVRSLMEYGCRFEATMTDDREDFVLGVRVPVESARPQSRVVDDPRVHNERSLVDVALRAREFVWIEDVIDAVESCASAPVYPLLTAEDEQLLMDHASANPKLMETLAREVLRVVSAIPGIDEVEVSVTNHNAMHDHQSFAEIRWVADQPGAGLSHTTGASMVSDDPFSFGQWLRRERARLRLSQVQLAEKLGVTASFLSRIESDARAPSQSYVESLARVLGRDPIHVGLRAGLLPSAMVEKIQREPERFQQLLKRL